MAREVDIETLHSLFECRDGELFWKNGRGGGAKAGVRAGHLCRDTGYRRVPVDGSYVGEHRVIYAMTHGKWPSGEVDHINRIKDDNRPCNLRDVTRQVNMRNSGCWRNSKSGVKGVYWVERLGKWKVSITPGGSRPVYIGVFTDREEAIMARKHAEKVLNFGGSK